MYPTGYGYSYRHWGDAVGSAGFPVTTSVGDSHPGSTSLDDGTPTTSSLGDTSRIDRLLGLAEEDMYQYEDEDTIPLPEELTQMFLPEQCKLCDVFLTSKPSAYSHYEGKVHQKAVAVYMKDLYGIKGSLLKRRNRFQPVFCEVCKTTLTSQVVHDTHLSGKPHAKNLKKMMFQPAEPVMEDDVDFMFQPPAPPMPPKLNEFVCDICHISTNTEHQLVMHKEGSKHKKKLNKLEREEEENEEYYDEEEDNLYEEEDENNEDDDEGPIEHVEDPNMDQPLQFGSGAVPNGCTVHTTEASSSSAQQTADSRDEKAENSKLWEYLVDIMFSDRTRTSVGEQKEREDLPGLDGKSDVPLENRPEMENNVNKVNPGAASILHKYKSALEAQKGDMITMIIPPDKSQTRKPDPKEPLYLPPEIRNKIRVTEQSVDSGKTTDSAVGSKDREAARTAGSSTSADILESPSEPYYNPNVDFHRRKSPSPEESLDSRWMNQSSRIQRYGFYRRGSQGYCKAGPKKYLGRGTNENRWERDATRRKYDERNFAWDSRSGWYRGRLPREGQYSRIRNRYSRYGEYRDRYGEYRDRYEVSSRRQRRSRSRSRTPETGFRRRRDDRRRKARTDYSRSVSSESTRSSSSGSSRTRSLRSRSSRSSSIRKSSKNRSSRNGRSGRSRKTRRSDKSSSRSRSESLRDANKCKSEDESPERESKLDRKRKRIKLERRRSKEGKKKAKSGSQKPKKMKPEDRGQSEERSKEDVKVKQEEPIRMREDLPSTFPKPIQLI